MRWLGMHHKIISFVYKESFFRLKMKTLDFILCQSCTQVNGDDLGYLISADFNYQLSGTCKLDFKLLIIVLLTNGWMLCGGSQYSLFDSSILYLSKR